MTAEQIDRQFDVVWRGKDYLCIPPFELARTCMQRHVLIGGEDFAKEPPTVDAYSRVVEALPGQLLNLAARTRLNKATVYTVLAKLRRQGKLVQTKPNDGFLIYALKSARGYGVRVTGQPE